MSEQHYLDLLIQSLQLLAADYQTQLRIFPSFVHVPDELALTFDDAFLLVEQTQRVELLNEQQAGSLHQLDELLSAMSDESESLWTLDALQHSPEWQHIRCLAKALLAAFGIPQQAPTLAGLTYITAAPGEDT